MFTIRLISYRLFKIFLILLVSSKVIVAQNCAEFGGYCQNHWDCCSNSCQSYLYRCTRGYNVYPYPFLGVSYKPIATLDDILEMNFGKGNLAKPNEIPKTEFEPNFASRFGGDDTTTEIKIILQNSEETTQGSTEKTPVMKETKIPKITNRLGEKEATVQPIYTETGGVEVILEKVDCTGTTTIESQFAVGQNNEEATTEIKKDDPCKEIGFKCYTNDECCSKRCHGFLHKCVT